MNGLPQKELLRVDEVADYFSVTPRTVYLWLENGKLEETRTPGNMIRVTKKSVDDWMSVCLKARERY